MGHVKVPPVPDYRIYKAEDIPHLRKLQARLAKHGLKDPWIRNEVWRFNPVWGSMHGRFFSFFFRGFRVGLPLFLIHIGFDKMFGSEDEHHSEHH